MACCAAHLLPWIRLQEITDEGLEATPRRAASAARPLKERRILSADLAV